MHLILALVTAWWLGARPPDGAFTHELWDANRDIYQEILRHPFIGGMTDGSLPHDVFASYLLQDAFYLREFAVALRVVAAKAPKKEWADLLERHAQESLDEEMRLHRTILADYRVSADVQARAQPPPDALAYTNFIVATAYRGSFGEAMSALLPCYWIYRELGRDLKPRSSPDASYRLWIESYASASYSQSVDEVLAIVDEVAEHADVAERRQMTDLYRQGSRYEWMFWEAAYRPRDWPPHATTEPRPTWAR